MWLMKVKERQQFQFFASYAIDIQYTVYSCNCIVESKVVLKAGIQLYIGDIFATIIGKVSSLQRFIS